MQVQCIKQQTEITFSNGDKVLVSYGQPVAAFIRGMLYETTTHWSVTTTRHINGWLCRFGTALSSDVSGRPQSWFDDLLKGVTLPDTETVIADNNNSSPGNGNNTLAALV